MRLSPKFITRSKEGLHFFSDDFVLRAMTRLRDVPAFGTFSLINELADQGRISETDLDGAVMMLRRNYAVDLPFDAEQILALAVEDNWRGGPSAFSFARSAMWQDPQRALSLYQECVTAVLCHDGSALANW